LRRELFATLRLGNINTQCYKNTVDQLSRKLIREPREMGIDYVKSTTREEGHTRTKDNEARQTCYI